MAIPDNNTTGVSTSILVSGRPSYLYDVDALVNITHTFPGDLDVTLTSPAGTVVTLSTDNGGTADNAFAGTRFDDDADPGSPLPYTSNPDLVNDHTYTIMTLAPLLAPEEPLAAFRGENPNGTWTLKVIDDAAGDTGTLNSWSLALNGLPGGAPNVVATSSGSNTAAAPIPDNDPAGVSSSITISGAASYLFDVDVTTAITHTFPGDLDIALTSPAGTVVTISTDNAATNDNAFNGTKWDDSADSGSQIPYAGSPNVVNDHTYAVGVPADTLAPEEALSAFTGENPNGTWTLKVIDDAGADTGSFQSWALSVKTTRCDTAVTGAGADAKGKQKLGKRKLAIAASVSATDEKLTTVVGGSVQVSGGPKRAAARVTSYGLAPTTVTADPGQTVGVTVGLGGSKHKRKHAFAALRRALDSGRKVTATLQFTFTDQLGHTTTLTRT